MERDRNEVNNDNRRNGAGIGTLIMRIIVSAIVLAVTAFFTPGFSVAGWWPLLLAAVAIAVVHYLVEKIFNFDASPFGRGIVGFIVSAAIIYAVGWFIQGVYVTMWGAIIAALVIGIISAILPGGNKVFR